MRNKVYINILTSSPLSSKDDGQTLLEIWKSEMPSLLPEKVGNYEPLKINFVLDDLDSALRLWSYPFMLRRRQPKMSGSIFMGGGKIPTHGWVHIVADFKQSLQLEIVNFIRKISVVFDADFAFVHLLTRVEFGDSYTKGVFTVRNDASMNNLSLSTHELRKNIPNIYWGTVLGRPYSNLFGADKFDNLPPCCSVEQLSGGIYYLQLSEKISDLETKFEEIDSCRHQIKDDLGSNAFFNPFVEPTHQYLLPTFNNLK